MEDGKSTSIIEGVNGGRIILAVMIGLLIGSMYDVYIMGFQDGCESVDMKLYEHNESWKCVREEYAKELEANNKRDNFSHLFDGNI